MSLVFASNVGLLNNSTWQQNLSKVRYSSTSFGDIDNDGDLDLALTGCLSDGGNRCENGAITKVYTNNGTSFIENLAWQNNLTGVGWSSISFGDIDNDGDLDLVLSGCTNASDDAANCNGDIISKIYINNGTSLIENLGWQSNLTAVFDPSMALGDIDNDGDLDLVLNGKSPSLITKVYINNGTSFIENSTWQSELTAINEGQIALGDVDNDGDLDLALSGDIGTPADFTSLYINNGTAFAESTQWNGNLVAMDRSSFIFGNYNNDAYLDLIICGHTTGDHCYLYKNNGSTFLLNQSDDGSGCLPGIYRASFAFGDYDNDGDLDLLGMGHEAGRTRTCENNATNDYDFVNDALSHSNISDDLFKGALSFGDIDNDRDLDVIIVAGDFGLGMLVSKVFINNNTIPNTQPLPPSTNFSSNYSISNAILNLSWGNGSDAETNTLGLYYNLMIGNSTNNHTIVSGVYGGSSGGGGGAGGGASGYFGNMMQRKNINLNVQLEANKTYYWYVQTIDTGLAKSNWSVTQSFTTSLDITKPSITINEPSPNASLHTTNPYFIFNATVTDANLTNVTLYANWNGSMIANETNSSSFNGTYIFSVNLTNNVDGHYAWYIGANDSSNNSETSGIRDFYLDRAYPIVRLISPANSASWTSSSTVTFTYNVTDTDIANCSLIIDNSIDQTDTIISVNINQTFTKTLANGNYNWNVNCTDYVGYTNSSAIRSLTVNYVVPTSVSGGGGGTASATPKTYAVTAEQLLQGYTQILSKNDKIKFSINNINHSLIVNSVNETLSYANLTLNSTPLNFLIYINETRKFELTNDNYYDLSVKLNFINNDKANLTIKSIYEKIEVKEEEKKEEEVGEEERKEEKLSEVKKYLFFLVIGIIIIVILITYSRKYIKYKRWKKWTLLG